MESSTNNDQTGSLNTTVFLIWPWAAAIAPYESEGVQVMFW